MPDFAHQGILACCIMLVLLTTHFLLRNLNIKGDMNLPRDPQYPHNLIIFPNSERRDSELVAIQFSVDLSPDLFAQKTEWRLCFSTIHLYCLLRRKLKYK